MSPLTHEGNKISGKALNNAVTIEEKVAMYPRVVIENEIIKLIPHHLRLLLDIDQDGLYFIHYLKDSRYVTIEFQKSISKILAKNLQPYKTPQSMGSYAKWHWLSTKCGYMFSHMLAQPIENAESL